MPTIDNLNFAVILNDEEFNAKIQNDIKLAKELNTSVSSLLNIKSKIPQMKVSIDTKNAEVSLEKLNSYFAELAKADFTKIGEKLDVSAQVNQALLQLKKLQEEIDVIQDLRQEDGTDMGLALEFKRAQEEANRLLATIAELRKTEKAVNAPSQFGSFIQSLTEQTMEQKQLIEYYKAEEAASKEVAREKAKEEAARKKNAEAIEKERRAQAKGEFKEYIQGLTAANPELKAMAQYYRELERETSRNAQAAQGAAVHQKTLNQQLEKTSRIGREIKGALAGMFSIYGAKAFISNLVRVTGEFELHKTSLGAILHDLNQAEAIISDIKELAIESPFQFKELTTYAKQLSAFSIPVEELFETTKMLADVSVGLNVAMDRLVLAYGQVRSATFLRGQEVRQFTEAGIPILDELARKFSEIEGTLVSTGDVFDRISAREVPFEMVADIFKEMTSEGGKFYKMQELQAETLKVKINNLKDAYEIMLNEIGESTSGALKSGVDKIRELFNNWEAIGWQLKSLVITFGAYKAAVALVNISDQIAKFGSLSKAIKNTAAAQKLLNSALLTNPYAAAAVAITALTLGIARGVKEANAFRKEMEGIANTHFDEAIDSVDRFKELVNNLNNAAEGSENFRNAISRLNREYGDYLPNLLTEKNALDEVKKSSDAVTRAIYARAKAQAYEKGQQKIEETYGEVKDYYGAEFINELVDKGIERKAARELFKNFTDEIDKQTETWNPYELFNKVYSEYYKTEDKFFTGFERLGNNIKSSIPFLSNQKGWGIPDFLTNGWQTAADALLNYSRNASRAIEDQNRLSDIVQAKFGNDYDPEALKTEIDEITSRFDKLKDAQKGVTQTREQFNDAIRKLDIARLKEEINVYSKFGRLEIVDNLKSQLAELETTAEGWRAAVIDILTTAGLTEQRAGALWPSAKKGTLEYGKGLIQQEKELREGLHYITDQDKELTNKFQKNLGLAQKIIQLLNLSDPKKGNKGESKEEKKLKRQIEVLRNLQKEYEDLKKLGASDNSIKTLFEAAYPDLIKENGKDFVTDLNYLERAIKLAEKLATKNPEAARKALASIGGDQVTQYKNNLEELNRSYEKSAKAAEKFFETMRKWKTEDFNIGGSGVLFDLRKIVSEFNSTTNQIELKGKKLKEGLNSIFASFSNDDAISYLEIREHATDIEGYKNLDIKDLLPEITKDFGKRIAKEVAQNAIGGFDVIKKTFVETFGEDAWDEFFDSLVTEGSSAIDKLILKNKEFEKTVAQNKIEDLAKEYANQLTADLNLTDWSDKTLRQISTIRESLANLMEGDSVVDTTTIEAIKAAGLTLEEFEVLVDKFLGKKFGEAVDEQMKTAQKAAQSFATIFGDLGGAFVNLGDATESEALGGVGQVLNVTEDVATTILECEALWSAVGDAAKTAASVTGEVAKATGGLLSSLSIITMIVKLVIIAIEQIANAIGASAKAQRELNMAAIEYAKVMNEISLNLADTMFGDNFRAILKENFEQTQRTYENLINLYLKLIEDSVANRDLSGTPKLHDMVDIARYFGFGAFYTQEMADALSKIFPDWTFNTIDGSKEQFLEYIEFLKLHRQELENALKNESGYKLSAAAKEDLAQILDAYEQYMKALEELKKSVQDIFGSMADDIVSNMIDAFKRTGDAAADLEKVFQNLGETLLKSLASSWVIDNILNKYEDRAVGILERMAFGEDEFNVANDLANLTNDIKSDLENGADFIGSLAKVFSDAGLLGTEGEDAQTLADGIKGITEDTANLLASYLNAIRADVSYARVIWERLDVTSQKIAASLAGFSAPNFMEYQMQIAANTQNIATNTERIMNYIGDVITSSDGPTGIRVYS